MTGISGQVNILNLNGVHTDEQKAAAQTIFNMLATAGQNLTVSSVFLHELEKMVAGILGLPVDYDAQQEQWDQESNQTQALNKLEFQQNVAETEQAITVAEAPPEPAVQQPSSPPTSGAKQNSGNPNPNPPPPQSSPKVSAGPK